jgi:hypothetical protein
MPQCDRVLDGRHIGVLHVVDTLRSSINVPMAILQPSSTSPIRHWSGMTTSVKKTSLNSASPVICRSGLTSTPGDDMSRMKQVMPL